jgi:Uma2 family endonuclease
MALDTRPWTRADLDRLPDDGNRYEVVRGALLVTPPPAPEHDEIVAWLAEKLFAFVLAQGLGRIHFPRSVVVAGPEQTEPDLMVRPLRPVTKWEDAPVPILVVEVLSRGTRQRDLHAKRDFYLACGVDEYWIVDRFDRRVTRVTSDGSETLTTTLRWNPRQAGGSIDIDIVAMFDETQPR